MRSVRKLVRELQCEIVEFGVGREVPREDFIGAVGQVTGDIREGRARGRIRAVASGPGLSTGGTGVRVGVGEEDWQFVR